MSPITDFYTGKTVLVTGGTGYMGKVLLEKLVRSFPEIKKIYILVRPKKGCTPEERVKKLTSGVIFTFNNMSEKAYEKIEAISSDITMENLNLSESDKEKLIKEVSIVFHVAASTRMDLSLKQAVIVNTVSTFQLFKLCINMKMLQTFVHVSTAFCNAEIDYMEEKVYPMDINPYKIMDLVEWMDDKSLVAITKSLLGSQPNTYTFTKRLTELIAKDMSDKIPIIITRPSIVMPSLRDPIAGWTDSYNGPVTLFYAGGKGILRVAFIDDKSVPQMIPVDVAINSFIVAGYERATNVYSPSVLNVTIGNVTKPTWRDYFDSCGRYMQKYPFKLVVWCQNVSSTTSYLMFIIRTILFQFLPALIIDFFMIIFLRKPFLTAIQKRILLIWGVLHPFTLRNWYFDNLNCIQLNEKLDHTDKKMFPMLARFEETDFDDYNSNNCKTACKYLFKETSDNYTLYRIRDKIFYIITLMMQFSFICFVLRWVLGIYF